MMSSKYQLGRAAVVALLAVVGVAACGGGDQAPAGAQPSAQPSAQVPAGGAPVAPAAEPAAAQQLPVPELLKNASLAVNEDRLAAPPGNNAIEYYLGVLAQEPNSIQATQALVDIFPLVASIAEREIAQRRVDEADRIVGLLDRASPGSYTVTTIKAKLETLRTQQQREQDAQQAAAERAAAEAAAAQAAAAQAAAAPTGTDATASSAAARPAPAAPAAPTPEPVAATPPPAAPTPAPTPSSGETRDARVVRQVPPEYPTQAARKRQTGWVELEFTVGADGKVKDVSVVRAQPPRVFDREAVRAVQQWTFEPALSNGQAIESKGRRRLEFQLQ
jgi:protein TonB